MEFKSKDEIISNDQKQNHTGERIPAETRNKIQEMLTQGCSQREIIAETGVSQHTVVGIRKAMPALDEKTWKKNVVETLRHVVNRGANRLQEEINEIPITAMPISLAVLIDKINVLSDQPTAVTEHRMRITHEELNDVLLNVTPKGELIKEIIVEPVTEPIVEIVVEPMPEPLPEPIPEPMPKPMPEPTPESAIEPLKEVIVEPTFEPITVKSFGPKEIEKKPLTKKEKSVKVKVHHEKSIRNKKRIKKQARSKSL